MTRTRAALALTLSLLAVSTLGTTTSAQSPMPASTPASTDVCAGVAPGSGMMGGPSASMGVGMMGDTGSSMGDGMMGASPAPATSIAPGASAVPGAIRIEMALLDTMRITIRAGVPIRFVVTNTGSIDHEFFLGDADKQAAHDQEMITMGSAAMHDGEPGMTVHAGATDDLTFTFETPGLYEAACHAPGHYPAGMKALITVVP